MRDEPNAGADMRAFRWRAEPLLRKLQVQRDVTQQLFAAAQRNARASRKAAEEQETATQQALAWTAGASTGILDPAALSRALAHVTRLAAQEADATAHAQACAHLADRAHAAWLLVESQLSCTRNVRSAARAEYASHQRRLVAKEADQLWLAQRRGK